jgi:adenylate kinase
MMRFPQQVLVLGPPGAGKGTQAARIAQRLGLVHISPGEILRAEFHDDSEPGQRIGAIMAAGELAPEEVVDEVVRERLERLGPEQGFVLDGYPRTAAEADSLRAALARLGRLKRRPLVVWLEVPRDELIRRLHRRRELEGRADDADETIARRLATYEAHAQSVREALEPWADVTVINGDRPPDAITEGILDRLRAPRRRTSRPSPTRVSTQTAGARPG